MKKMLTLVFVAAVFTVFGQSFEEELNRVETWINSTYRSSPRALKYANKRLDSICNSQKSEQEKMAELCKTFPEAFSIIVRELTWKIHSLDIAYDIQEGSAAETKITKGVKILDSLETGHQNSKSDQEIKKTSGGFGLQGSVNLNWLPKASGSISGHYENNSSGRSERGSAWSKKEQQVYQRNREKILSMINQTTTKNLHLTFTVTLFNSTDSKLTFDLSTARIPVYMGERSCNKMAKPVDDARNEKYELRPRNAGQDVAFRMELDTTTARKLVDFMAKDTPTIALEKGSIKIENSSSKEDMLTKRNFLPEHSLVVLSGPTGSLSWKIRKYYILSENVTIAKACEAISQDVKKHQDPLFTKDERGWLNAVSGVPFGKFKVQGKAGAIAFVEYKGNIYSDVSDELLKKPIGNDGFTIHIVDIAALVKIQNPKLIRAIIKRYNRLEGSKEFKGALACKIALYFKNDYDKSNYYKWLKTAIELGDKEAKEKAATAKKEKQEDTKPKENKQADLPQPTEGYVLSDIRRKANGGDSESQFQLGQWYALGQNGLKKNEQEAAIWYEKAAKQNHVKAQYSLGCFYFFGQGVPQNREIAADWYRKAAEQGCTDAQYELGRCYYLGLIKAPCTIYFTRREGNPPSIKDILKDNSQFKTYPYGRRYRNAEVWYRKAAKQGHKEAMRCFPEVEEKAKYEELWEIKRDEGWTDLQIMIEQQIKKNASGESSIFKN